MMISTEIEQGIAYLSPICLSFSKAQSGRYKANELAKTSRKIEKDIRAL